MIAISVENGIHLFFEEIASGRIFAHVFDPHGEFGLEVHACFVARLECGFRRTPGVETYVVHSIFLDGVEDTLPVIDVCRRIAGQRENRAVQHSAQVNVSSVQTDVMLALFHISHAESPGLGVCLAIYVPAGLKLIQIRCKFIPEFHLFTHRKGLPNAGMCLQAICTHALANYHFAPFLPDT